MIIDSSHRSWILATTGTSAAALAAYAWLDGRTPGGLTGGSVVGLWYGIAAAALMIFAGLLAGLRRVPSWWWLGSRAAWLRGHIWLGLLSVLLAACHAGFGWGGSLERCLWFVLALVAASGVFGLALQQFLPRLLASRVPGETPYEQIPHVCEVMRRTADQLVEEVCGPAESPAGGAAANGPEAFARLQLREFHRSQVRPFLAASYARTSPLADPLRAESAFARFRTLPLPADMAARLAQLERFCDARRQLAEQERLHRWLHGWLFVHVPLSMALLVLGVAHAWTALYY